MSSLRRQNKAQSCQRRAEISKEICFLRLKEEKKLMLIFVFKLLKPFKSWFLTHPLWRTARLELEMWISRLHAEHSRVDLQVGKTFLYMVSNVLTCWGNRCYITSKGGKIPKGIPPELDSAFLKPQIRFELWWSLRSRLTALTSRRASTIPGGVPAPRCSGARFRLSGWRSERRDALPGWSTCRGSEFWRLVLSFDGLNWDQEEAFGTD